MNAKDSASTPKPAPSTIRSGRKRKRQRGIEAEIRAQARQIHEQGMADAMKAAALMIVARKLDEIRALLTASGVNVTQPMTLPASIVQPPQQVLAPVVKNPCVQCGREGVYRTRPNQWNRTGSWHCRAHMALAGQIEQEDRMDRAIQPQPAPAPPPALQPAPAQPAAGASSLAEAMGIAEVVE